jgi:hypothetical protein
MKTPQEQAIRKPYHHPEVKDYGKISQITKTGVGTTAQDSSRRIDRT